MLVFVTKKADSELVAEKIKSRGMPGMHVRVCGHAWVIRT